MPTTVVVGRGLADGVVELRDRRSGRAGRGAGGRRARRDRGRGARPPGWLRTLRAARALDPASLLVLVAFAAGWVDAVVGGGGLIQLPALLIGLPDATPPAAILGTNKVSSVWGTATSSITYAIKIRPDWRTIIPLVVGSAVGSAVGAQLARYLPKAYFTPIVLVALIGVGHLHLAPAGAGLVSRRKHDGRAHYGRTAAIGLGRRRVRRVPRAGHRLVLRDLAGRRARATASWRPAPRPRSPTW